MLFLVASIFLLTWNQILVAGLSFHDIIGVFSDLTIYLFGPIKSFIGL